MTLNSLFVVLEHQKVILKIEDKVRLLSLQYNFKYVLKIKEVDKVFSSTANKPKVFIEIHFKSIHSLA